MELKAGSAVFLDTNVLIYASFPGLALHESAVGRLVELQLSRAVLWTSRQVLREYLSACSRPGTIIPSPAPGILADAICQFEAQFQIADEDSAVTALLVELIRSGRAKGKQVHDANIVATMQRHGIEWLLTHNTADFIRYSPGVGVIPLIP